MSNKEKRKVKREPTLGFAIFTLIVLILFVGIGIAVLKWPIIVLLFCAWLLLVPFALYLGNTTEEIETSIYDMAKSGVGLYAMLIVVGMLITVWITAGTVPAIIAVGLKIVAPKFFLFLALIICTLTSCATGTSWGTMGTAGIAMMGVGIGLGIPAPMVAGAVVSGSYFGDKMSPVSDTVLLSSTVVGCPVMKHVKHMAYSAIPAWILSAVFFLIIGFVYAGGTEDTANTEAVCSSLSQVFHLGLPTLIPAIVVIALLALHQSAVGSILLGVISGVLVSVFYQGIPVSDMGGFLVNGFSVDIDNEILSSLLNRGGIMSMMELVGVVVGALGLGGILKGSGIIETLIKALASRIKNIGSLVLVTAISCICCVALVGDNYFSMVMNGTLMGPLFKSLGYKPENASRVIGDVSCCGSMFVPWNAGAVFVAATLGVPILKVLPFAVFHILIIILDVLYGFTGFSMSKLTPEEQAETMAEIQ